MIARQTMAFLAVVGGFSAMALAQFPGPGGGAVPGADPEEKVKIVQPTVDKEKMQVTLPGAFWKEEVADWVEVAVSGRPSDFLHETLISVTTTRTLLEQACRDAGFHDADAWTASVKDFPRVRGDRMLITVNFSKDGKPATYALDELLAFQGWNGAIGPYGFMFRGDPGRGGAKRPATAPTTEGGGELSDGAKILRDDPQVSLIFKGLQSVSQSFADHPLAYDDWIFRMPDMVRNYSALDAKTLHSNGAIPLTVTVRKVGEEEFLTTSAAIWHDAGWQALIKQQVPTGKEIDANKAKLWAIVSKPAEQQTAMEKREIALLMVRIERGYATLDAAWAAYSVDHANFKANGDDALKNVKQNAERWKMHGERELESAQQREIAAVEEDAARAESLKANMTDADKKSLRQHNGREIAALARALKADLLQPLEYWKGELAQFDPGDSRSDWINIVKLQVALCNAKVESSMAGEMYGEALAAEDVPTNLPGLQRNYEVALASQQAADVRVKLANLDFQIRKIEALTTEGAADPELAAMKAQRDELKGQLASLEEQIKKLRP